MSQNNDGNVIVLSPRSPEPHISLSRGFERVWQAVSRWKSCKRWNPSLPELLTTSTGVLNRRKVPSCWYLSNDSVPAKVTGFPLWIWITHSGVSQLSTEWPIHSFIRIMPISHCPWYSSSACREQSIIRAWTNRMKKGIMQGYSGLAQLLQNFTYWSHFKLKL